MPNYKKISAYIEVRRRVGDFQIETDALLKGHLTLALLVTPIAGLERVSKNALKFNMIASITGKFPVETKEEPNLLIETRIEVERDVTVLAQQIHIEASRLLVRRAIDNQLLSDGKSIGKSALIGNRLDTRIISELSFPVHVKIVFIDLK